MNTPDQENIGQKIHNLAMVLIKAGITPNEKAVEMASDIVKGYTKDKHQALREFAENIKHINMADYDEELRVDLLGDSWGKEIDRCLNQMIEGSNE